jgi:hypothetical protein
MTLCKWIQDTQVGRYIVPLLIYSRVSAELGLLLLRLGRSSEVGIHKFLHDREV